MYFQCPTPDNQNVASEGWECDWGARGILVISGVCEHEFVYTPLHVVMLKVIPPDPQGVKMWRHFFPK